MKILYIAGVAHSGSTYTARVLNQHSNIFTAGELLDIHEQADNQYDACACRFKGETRMPPPCSFWTELMEPIRADIDLGRTARLNLTRNREWLTALWQTYRGNVDPAFREGNRILFGRIKEYTDSEIIIDASKSPWRLIPLADVFKDQLYVLHIIRRPEHQLSSKRRRNYNFYRSALMKYPRKNLLYSLLYGNSDRYFRMKFERFVKEPNRTLKTLYRWLGVEHEDPFSKPQQDYHHLCGSNARLPTTLKEPDPARITSSSGDWNLLEKTLIKALHFVYNGNRK